MARNASKAMPSQRFPFIPLFLAAALLTALGAITHSGNIQGLFPIDRHDEGFLYVNAGISPLRQFSFLETTPKFNRTKYTFDTFVVAGGIDLAGFGLDNNTERTITQQPYISKRKPHFELFEDFDLSQKIKGNETWIELLEYRRDATHPSLSFYVDKVAFKRWLLASYSELKIDGPKSYLLKYASELYRDLGSTRSTQKASKPPKETLLAQEVLKWLPSDMDYAAKPTHLSCSGGVWLVHNDMATNTTYIGNGKKKMKVFKEASSSSTTSSTSTTKSSREKDSKSADVRKEIAEDLSQNLQKVQEKCGRTVIESYALRHVRPGIVVEERFTQPSIATSSTNEARNTEDDNDNESLLKGGMEFKVFTIWGKAWLTVWRPGTDGVKALFFRNGTNLVFDPPVKKNKKTKPPSSGNGTPEIHKLPKWLDWDKVISIAETLGSNKDMFRTDIFVGVVESGEISDRETIRYVVSETEIHPTPLRGFEEVFEEAGRLWLAGYYYLFSAKEEHQLGHPSSAIIRVVPNMEVPRSFYK